jgi:hypothetical protein
MSAASYRSKTAERSFVPGSIRTAFGAGGVRCWRRGYQAHRRDAASLAAITRSESCSERSFVENRSEACCIEGGCGGFESRATSPKEAASPAFNGALKQEVSVERRMGRAICHGPKRMVPRAGLRIDGRCAAKCCPRDSNNSRRSPSFVELIARAVAELKGERATSKRLSRRPKA